MLEKNQDLELKFNLNFCNQDWLIEIQIWWFLAIDWSDGAKKKKKFYFCFNRQWLYFLTDIFFQRKVFSWHFPSKHFFFNMKKVLKIRRNSLILIFIVLIFDLCMSLSVFLCLFLVYINYLLNQVKIHFPTFRHKKKKKEKATFIVFANYNYYHLQLLSLCRI